MGILIVDDSKRERTLIAKMLRQDNYEALYLAEAAREAKELIIEKTDEQSRESEIELVLLDLVMPEKSGIEFCQELKSHPVFKQIPVIIFTARDNIDTLKKAFSAGAEDYINKPIHQVELLARVKSVLDVNQELKKQKKLVTIDSLTNMFNRRAFDRNIYQEWKRSFREKTPLSLLMADIDYFKEYNDTYGHQAGDKCLKKIADGISDSILRPGDMAARYGGEEFTVLLAKTDLKGGLNVAERLKDNIESLKINHQASPISDYVTISIGVAFAKPETKKGADILINAADKALYKAKNQGRNQLGAELQVVTGLE